MSRRESGNRGRDDLVGGSVVVRRSERAAVERVVDGTAQADVSEQRSARVEDDVVDERRLIEEVPLPTGSRGGARAPYCRSRRSPGNNNDVVLSKSCGSRSTWPAFASATACGVGVSFL